MSLETMIAKLMLKLPTSWKIKLAGGEPVTLGGRTLDPNFQLIAHGASRQPPMSSLPPETAQAAAIEGFAMLAAKPESGVSWHDAAVPAKDGHAIPVRIYRPDDQDPNAPVIAYWHMGGGVIGNIETCHAFCTMLAKYVRCPVVSVDYRLAPQFKFPTGLEDCLSVYEWCLASAETLGAPGGRASVGGDSMGGNFSAIIAQETRRRDIPMPDAQILIYPATDMLTPFASYDTYSETYPLSADTMNWFMEQYLPDGHNRGDVLLSPGLETRLEGLPPAIIATAGFDPLVDDGAAYADKLKAAGVSVDYVCFDSLAHGFTAFTDVVPAAREACLSITARVRSLYNKL